MCKFPLDCNKTIDNLVKRGITQTYVIGGFGTMRGINDLKTELRKRKLNI